MTISTQHHNIMSRLKSRQQSSLGKKKKKKKKKKCLALSRRHDVTNVTSLPVTRADKTLRMSSPQRQVGRSGVRGFYIIMWAGLGASFEFFFLGGGGGGASLASEASLISRGFVGRGRGRGVSVSPLRGNFLILSYFMCFFEAT